MLLCRCRGGDRRGRDHHRSIGARGDRRGRGRRRPRAGSARGRGPGGGGSGRARAGRPCGGGVGQRDGARAAVTAAGDVALLVVRLSDSFGDFWPALARELDVPLTEWTPGPDAPPPPRAGVVLVAAGGHETEVGSVLLLLGMPADIPVVAVGASTSHRVAAQAVAAGASDYFALPDDRDGLRDAPAVAVPRRRAPIRRPASPQSCRGSCCAPSSKKPCVASVRR